MSADRARFTYYPPRKYREVLSQQGRVLLEADSNEGHRISTEETRHEALDFVGPCGTPDGGYAIAAAGADFTIEQGTMYVGGLRTTLEAIENYTAQPDWLDPVEIAPWGEGLWQSPADLAGKNFEATLLLREQEITAVEDPALRDVALGGPDSCARTRLLQRVVAADTAGSTCAEAAGDVAGFWSAHGLVYNPATAEMTSRALLQVTPVTNAPPVSPCDPPSATGYLGADNQMLRVMVTAFDPGTNSGTLLWGYYNASTLYRCTVQTALTVQLATRPISAEYQPRSGQVVQILQRAADLGEGAFAAALTGHFAKLTASYAPDGQLVTLPAAMPQPPYANGSNVYLRLWEDQANFTLGSAVVLAGTGLQVTITESSAGPLHNGDYWAFAARPLTPNTVYPERILAAPQPPDGPRMWACPLAVLEGGETFSVLEDCRPPFDNLVELTARTAGDCCCIKVVPAQAKDLQKLIDQAAATTGAKIVIELAAGTYTLPRPLIFTAKHRGLVLEACTGGRPILRAAEQNSPAFFFGLILAMSGADLTLRGLELDLPLASASADTLQQVIAKSLKKIDWVPKSVCFGIRAAYCDSLAVEYCYFQFPQAEESYGAGIFVQGDTAALTVRSCRFFGQPNALLSIFTGVLAAPFILAGQDNMRSTSINLARIEDCLFGFLSLGVLLAGEIRYAWASGNTSRSVYGGLYLISLTAKFKLPSEVMAFVPPKSVDPAGKAKAIVVQQMASAEFVRALGVGMAVGLSSMSGKIKDPVLEKPVTLGAEVIANNVKFAAIPGSPMPSLCLTLQGNHFDCRPLAGEMESIAAVFLWDTNAGSCFANVSGNTLWNRSAASPALTIVTLAGFNVTGNMLFSDPSQTLSGAAGRSMALWVEPGPAVPNAAKIPVNVMTVTGNTIFGGTNLKDLPRKEWDSAAKGLDTWEFFNTIVP
jgi:hypothetical protein